MKRILSVLLALVMIVGMIPMSILSASAAEVTATVTFDDTAKRTVGTTSQQVWVENGVTFTNDKASSTSNVNTSYYNPVRLYKGSSATISYSGVITKIEVTCASADYATVFAASAGAEATANSTVVTIVPTAASNSYTIASFSAQTRVSSVTVYATVSDTACEHANTTTVAATAADCTNDGYTEGVYCNDCYTYTSGHEVIEALGHDESSIVTAATCTAQGYTTYTCATCGNVRTADYVNATGHTLVDSVCSSCGAEQLDLSKATAIAVGDEIIFVCETATVEMNGFYSTSYAYGTAYTDAPMGEYLWTVADGASEGTYAFVNSNGAYLAWSSGNSAKTSNTLDTNSSWTVTFDESGNAVVANAADSTRLLQWNATNPRFACYTSTQTAIQIYVKACEHTNTTTTTVDATCTEAGSTTVTCDDCGETISTTVIEALGHNYENEICTVCGAEYNCEHATTTTNTVDATCTTAGSVTVTCDACGEVISTEEIAALGHTEVEDAAVDATCTATGLTAGSHCSVCSEVIVAQTETEALGHSYTDGVCSVCSEAEPAEDVKIVFELGDNGSATHNDGSSATTYSETVNGYTLNITDGTKMYTGAVDATGNGCIKLGTSSVVGGFSFTVPDDVTEVVICIAKYKAKTTKVNVNGTEYTLTNSSDSGTYDEITVDTSTSKTVSVTTVSGACRAMVNSITFICSETDHTCVWGEGVVTTVATCTTDGVMTYTCTVDGCTKTEPIDATGHTYVYGESAITCSVCDYNAAYTLSTIADAKAFTDASAVYYIKGIVTYVSGKNVYIEDATGAICVYFNEAPSDIVLGDEILVWDCMTTYNGLIETTNTTSQEYVKVSSGNALPSQTITIAALNADTTNEYLGERVVIENVTMGVINASGNTPLTDADGNTINLYKVSGLNEDINLNDVVTVTAIVSTYNAYQLIVNPGTAADDVVEVEHHDEVVIETITIAEAKAGTAGEYYQVEGVVTFIDGRNVYIQDATGGIVVYLTADAATTQVGDTVKAYGALAVYNGLIELSGIDETNTEFYEILSSGNTVDAQTVTIEALNADTSNEYLAEKITLENVYVSYYSYSSSYGNVTYTLTDGNGNTIQIYRVTVASEAECAAAGSIVNVEAVVSSYNGYQLVTTNDKIVVTGTCAHETTQLVNYTAPTCTEAGYSGDTECVVCGYWTARGAETAATGHNYNAGGICANNCGIVNVAAIDGTFYTSFADAYAAATGTQIIKLLANAGEDTAVELTKDLYVDLNGFTMNASAAEGTAYTVYGIDSCTDSYEAEEWGYLTVTNATVAPLYNSYLAVDEGDLGWSFHAFSVKLTHVSLKADADALGYKAQFFGDEVVQSYVTGFGFSLWVTENNVITKSQATATNGEEITLRLQGIMAANGGEMAINAEAFVTFSNAGTAKSNSHSTTMKDTIETIETNLENSTATYTEAQITSIQGLITKYESKMSGWNIDTIKAWTASTEA